MDEQLRHGSPSPFRYYLAPHVHACYARGDIVLLDVRNDRYIGIDSSDNAELCAHVGGLPPTINAGSNGSHSAGASNSPFIAELLKSGLIQNHGAQRLLPETGTLRRAESVLIEGYTRQRTKLTAADVASGIHAMTKAAILLRWLSFEQNILRLHRIHSRKGSGEFDLDRARRAVLKFRKLRPIMYADHDACLFSSLAMHEFLARRGLFPRVVLGVATRPFSAHCWLQHDTVVVNDELERVNEYSPILCI